MIGVIRYALGPHAISGPGESLLLVSSAILHAGRIFDVRTRIADEHASVRHLDGAECFRIERFRLRM